MSDKSRRKLLKSIAAGSGAIVAGKSLPESWSRPVVDSVMLPAHAETSPPVEEAGPLLMSGSSSNNNASIDGQMYQDYASNDTGVIERVVSKFVTNASAENVRPDVWTCYAEKLDEPLNDPDGEWILFVKQSKFKEEEEDCPTKERVWKEKVIYDSGAGNNGESEKAVTTTNGRECGFNDPDKDGKLVFKLKNAVDRPQIKIIKFKGGKDINLNVFLYDGGRKPKAHCCDD